MRLTHELANAFPFPIFVFKSNNNNNNNNNNFSDDDDDDNDDTYVLCETSFETSSLIEAIECIENHVN